MAENRKRRYTYQEALSFPLSDIETLEGSNANVPRVKEIFGKNEFERFKIQDYLVQQKNVYVTKKI